MYKVQKYLVAGFFILSLGLASCGGKSFDEHSSASGLMPEQYLPANPSLVFSYSLMDDDQSEALTALMEKVGDKNKASKTVSEALGSGLNQVSLDYDQDLAPAFGKKFRYVYENVKNGDTTDVYSVVTLENPDKMLATLDTLASSGKVQKKTFNDFTAYVNDGFYATVNEDLLLIATSADALMTMKNMKSGDSLWEAASYRNSVDKIKGNHVFYALIYPQNLGNTVSFLGTAGLAGMASILDQEGLILRAEKDGLKIEGFASADKDKAKTAGITLDQVAKGKAYLLKEVPAENLMFYVESYGLKQTLTQSAGVKDSDGFKKFASTVQNYLGMNLEDEILSFMDKGYAIAVSANADTLFPGVSLFIDTGSDEKNAETFISKVDAQIGAFMTILSAALPGAVSKEQVQIMGKNFNSLVIDFNKIPRTGSGPLPDILTAKPIRLSYGVLDKRILITTADTWSSGKFTSVEDSDLYSKLTPKLKDVDQGLVLVDLEKIGNFAGMLKALREQLGLSVNQNFDLQKALEGFAGVILSSRSKSYDSKVEGFLELSE